MRFGGIVLAALLLLGACSSDPQPKEPKRSATTSDPTPTATVPTMPAQAQENSPEGAAAFVKHYIDVFNYAASTGDVNELTRLSSPDCEGCQSYIKLYKATYEAGGYFRGGDWNIGALSVDSGEPETFLTTRVKVDEGRFREERGSSEHSDPGESNTVTFALMQQDKAWVMSQLGLGAVQ
jgi:hypothetical protein